MRLWALCAISQFSTDRHCWPPLQIGLEFESVYGEILQEFSNLCRLVFGLFRQRPAGTGLFGVKRLDPEPEKSAEHNSHVLCFPGTSLRSRQDVQGTLLPEGKTRQRANPVDAGFLNRASNAICVNNFLGT